MDHGSQAGQDGEDDLAILHPERKEDVAGVSIVMREYSYVESLELAQPIADLTDAICGLVLAGTFEDLDSLRVVFGANANQIIALMAIACDQPATWVGGLDADDGELLQMLWWGVNARFFLRRVLVSLQIRRNRKSGSPTSMAPSLAPAMTRTPSETTRSVN